MNDELSGWKRNAAALGAVAVWMKTFSARIIGHVLAGGNLDRDVARSIKEGCLLEIKNLDVVGIEITEETELLRQILEQFDKLAEIAISEGWETNDA